VKFRKNTLYPLPLGTLLLAVGVATCAHGQSARQHHPEDSVDARTSVVIDGRRLQFEHQAPVIIGGRLHVPMRSIFEQMGATVRWAPETQRIHAVHGQRQIVLQPGQRRARVGDRWAILDSPVPVINGRTLVPLRFVGESLGAQVVWRDSDRTVMIDTQAAPDPFSNRTVFGTPANVRIVVDGRRMPLDTQPRLINDQLYVPMRIVLEAIGAEVEWVDNRKIVGRHHERPFEMIAGNVSAIVDGRHVMMDQPPLVIAGRVMIPIRFVGEALGAQVDWRNGSREVVIATTH
jgi:hypothetical protein